MDQTIQYSHNEGRDGMGESGKGDTGRGWALSLIARGGRGGQSLGASYQVRLQSVHERDKAAAGRRETHISRVIQDPRPPPLP